MIVITAIQLKSVFLKLRAKKEKERVDKRYLDNMELEYL